MPGECVLYHGDSSVVTGQCIKYIVEQLPNKWQITIVGIINILYVIKVHLFWRWTTKQRLGSLWLYQFYHYHCISCTRYWRNDRVPSCFFLISSKASTYHPLGKKIHLLSLVIVFVGRINWSKGVNYKNVHSERLKSMIYQVWLIWFYEVSQGEGRHHWDIFYKYMAFTVSTIFFWK